MANKRKRSEAEKQGTAARRKICLESKAKTPKEKCIPGYGSLIQDDDGYLDFSDYSLECQYCKAQHYFFERLANSTKAKTLLPDLCCTKGTYKPVIAQAPKDLQDLFTSNSQESRHFKKNIRSYNNAFSLASVQANWVSRGMGASNWNPTYTVQGKMYHLLGALNPPENVHPRYASLYVYDTDNSIANRKRFHPGLKDNILLRLEKILHENNHLVRSFVTMNEKIKSGRVAEDVDLVIHAHKPSADDHDRKYNLPQASEVALISVNENCGPIDVKLQYRGIINKNGHEKLKSIHMCHRIYDPAVFPLLLPFGEDGWHSELKYDTKTKDGNLTKVSPLKFYGRFLFYRRDEFSLLLNSGRLFQQYLTEAFYKIESERLSWLRANQHSIRSADYTKLHDTVGDAMTSRNEVDMILGKDDFGKVVILPPSHIGSERYMRQKMYDIMAISNNIGHPDIFITLTCNPQWKEIEVALLPGQTAADRPDLCNRVFRMKHKHLIKYLRSGKPFGRVAGFASVIEFQKRGLVHAHIILFLSAEAKKNILDPAKVDKIISAEIPGTDSTLRASVVKHMIHTPCLDNPHARCLKKDTGRCSKRYPMDFKTETAATDGDYYMSYKRRSPEDGGEVSEIHVRVGKKYEKVPIDNSWVVPYCPKLLSMYRSHMNVELCISRVGSIKYLFKYICKGPDRITVEVKNDTTKAPSNGQHGDSDPGRDEISLFQDARYYSASESAWRLFEFPMVEHYPPIERLAVHLKDQQMVYFKKGEHEKAALTGKDNPTKLMGWFDANALHPAARHIRFMDYPRYFTWNTEGKRWKPRSKIDFSGAGEPKIGRMYSVSPRDRERYFLRTLLLHKAGATSFEDMRTIDGVVCESYQDACAALGLLADDAEWNRCMEDAIKNRFEPLTKVFATILAHCETSNPKRIWDKFTSDFITDLRHRHSENFLEDEKLAKNYCLLEVKAALEEMNVNFGDFGFPSPDGELIPLSDTDVPIGEVQPDMENMLKNAASSFNDEQHMVFNTIVGEVLPGTTADALHTPMSHVSKPHSRSRAYFLDAPGGTGKTFVIRAIHALLTLREKKTITVASSAVAASLLDGGRTAHSTFKIPIPCFEDSVCNISLESKLAISIRDADLIIWDEIVMAHRTNIEAVNRTLQTIMNEKRALFGGKLILFSGDFRQILPVVPRGSRGMIVNACLKSSSLFSALKTLNLTINMRLETLKQDKNADPAALVYPQYLLDVGEGKLETDEDDYIQLPLSLNVLRSTEELISSVYPDMASNYLNQSWVTSRAILATTNARLQQLNELIGEQFPGLYRNFLSADTVTSDDDNDTKALELKYPPELLNSMPGNASLPDHALNLKIGFIVMLLRNIRPLEGHVNGTRYIVQNMTKNILLLKAVSGSHPGRQFVLPRMNCIPGKDDYPIPGFRRCQFPVRVCFAMTINKSQGQSISGKLGIDLSSHCFSHGQLYVALSRTTHPKNVHILIESEETIARNVVYSEVFGIRRRQKSGPFQMTIPPSRHSSVQVKTEHLATPNTHVYEQKIVPRPQCPTEHLLGSVDCAGINLLNVHMNSVLQNETYLHGDAINSFIRLLASDFPKVHQWDPNIPTHIYGSVFTFETFVRDVQLESTNLNTCDIVLTALNDDNHWGLAVVQKSNRTIHIYDSVHTRQQKSAYFQRQITNLRKWCNSLRDELDNVTEWPDKWRTTRTTFSPLQLNDKDCGVFTLLNAYFYVMGKKKPTYTQSDIPTYRKLIYLALLHEDIRRIVLF